MQQTEIHFKGNDCYWRSHKLGTILQSESIFRSVKRTRKNIMRVFWGLGCNEQLLIILKKIGVRFIEVPYCDEILKTTVDKWLKKGIRSPYSSNKVDQQIVLRLDKINLHDNEQPQRFTKYVEQPSLFEV